MNKTCFMFGHGDCPECIMPRIEQAIENCYTNYCIRDFYVGNRGRFDSMAATAVTQAKLRHTDIRLYLLLAYHPAERAVDLWGGFDGSYYPPFKYRAGFTTNVIQLRSSCHSEAAQQPWESVLKRILRIATSLRSSQ